MTDFTEHKNHRKRIAVLERELNLKQLQVNRLLNITQAINNNLGAKQLFEMYTAFLGWEIGVKQMALYIRDDAGWKNVAALAVDGALLDLDISQELTRFSKLEAVNDHPHPLIGQFDVVIPVRHKEEPIAYVFIGGFGEDDDMYNKIQFITTITNVISVAIENKRLFKQQLRQARIQHEMELAGGMQRMLIPESLPDGDCYELASIYQPHLGIGGDYFDFVRFPDGKIYLCVGDISGKGIAAALLMANFQANFHTLLKTLRSDLTTFVRELNEALNFITKGERFITFFIAEYNTKTRELRYVNAGHNPPVLVDEGRLELLTEGCTILGSFDELPRVDVGTLVIQGEALILTYTDGLTDIKNDAGDFLNEELLYQFVQQNYRSGAEDFNRKLQQLTRKFIGDQSYPDDFTVLTCKIKPQP